MVFHEVQGRVHVGVDQLALHGGTQRLGHRPHKERHGLFGNAGEHQLHDQPVHQRTFCVVHPEPALAVGWRAHSRREVGQLASGQGGMGFDQVFNDRT